jgi:hypothetical protein
MTRELRRKEECISQHEEMAVVPADIGQQRGMVIRAKQLLASLAFVLYAKATVTLKISEKHGFSVVEHVL